MNKSKKNNTDKGASIYFAVSFLLLFNVLSLPCFGQGGTKKKVTEKDYGKWGTLHTVDVAEQADWVSFRMVYENADTLFVTNSSKAKKFLLPNGTEGRFIGDSHFAYRQSPFCYEIISLSDSRRIRLNGVQWLDAVNNKRYIVTSSATSGSPATMFIRDRKGVVLREITDVVEYSISPDKNAMAYIVKKGPHFEVWVVDLDTLSAMEIASGAYRYTSLAWQKDGSSVAFVKSVAKSEAVFSKICCYNRSQNNLKECNIGDKLQPAGRRIDIEGGLVLSSDGDKVFFSADGRSNRDIAGGPVSDSPEIWYSNTPLLYPTAKWIEGFQNNAVRYVWYPNLGMVNRITTKGMTQVGLTGRENYAIATGSNSYPVNYKFYPEKDYHIISIKDKSQTVMLEKQSSDPSMISLSPVSDLLAYYTGEDWHLYDPAKQVHRNLTLGIDTKWDTGGENHIPPVIPYGVAGWSEDGNGLLLYDKFDIWFINVHSGKAHRITNGREHNMVFRLELNLTGKAVNTNRMVLVAYDNAKATRRYCLWKKDAALVNLCSENTWNDQISGDCGGNLIFREQSFEAAPRLVFISAKTNERKIIHYSNAHQKQYEWGRSELVRYSDGKGNKLNAALFYPAGYMQGTKYPMIVFIYESLSQRLHQYKNPSMHNEDGFNTANYTLDGYFVLMPDINYTIGSPGESATDCISAAVAAALETGSIDRTKIGLIGHSFGGYETNITVTKSDIFAAAVSGAGVSDVTGTYFSIGEDIGEPEAWRFENQQYRMGKSFFEDHQAYADNSPIVHAAAIRTPLLLWSGKDDSTVKISQSIAMHIALRRLNKQNIFLAYPKESHVIRNKLMQEDLTVRIREWFAYFLKDDRTHQWIAKGLR
ncbi:S9 family peptidase [Flavobacterium beibuense]|uniref:Peptidase family S9, prolyl oligopeptidase active site domain protein n=1 Tax=Flavobacterium beibuense TaxID=657326 RepID=A0A444WEZ9_9FLAO|nr:prolyl oligopeptidase family serine peptidase [Flavobacterium beibuense]RYJ44284.1 Peptidase family S9, prolyl oligopeptidase active site domain protein [Flavobacterium beibuense]